MSDLIDRARALRAEMLTSEVAEQQLLELVPALCDALEGADADAAQVERWKFEAFGCAEQRDKAADTLARALGHESRFDVSVPLGSVIAQSIAELAAAEITSLRAQLSEAEAREAQISEIVTSAVPEAVPFNDVPTMLRGIVRQRDGQHEIKDHLAVVARKLTEENVQATASVVAMGNAVAESNADLAAARTALDEAQRLIIRQRSELDEWERLHPDPGTEPPNQLYRMVRIENLEQQLSASQTRAAKAEGQRDFAQQSLLDQARSVSAEMRNKLLDRLEDMRQERDEATRDLAAARTALDEATGTNETLRTLVKTLTDELSDLDRQALGPGSCGQPSNEGTHCADFRGHEGSHVDRNGLNWPAGLGEQQSDTGKHPESYCHRCNGPNVSWAAPSPLWNQVMRGGDINGPWLYDEIICPTCFAVLAEEVGAAANWRLVADVVDADLQTVTPSGRVWDEHEFRWIDAIPEPGEQA